MRLLVNLIRILLGLCFVASALLKITDAVGFSFQLKEYLDLADYAFQIHQPVPLVLAVILIIIEFITGVMLLLGYAFSVAKWGSFFITLFFTCLALYPALVTNSQVHSYLQGTLFAHPVKVFALAFPLFILSIFIFGKDRYIRPIFKLRFNKWVVFFSFVFCLALTYRVVRYLPIVDHSDYPIGVDFFKNMSLKEIGLDTIPNENLPETIDQESPQDTLGPKPDEKILLVVSIDLTNTHSDSWDVIGELLENSKDFPVEVRGLTASNQAEIDQWVAEFSLDLEFVRIAKPRLKAMVRANPELILLENGIIVKKVHWLDAKKITFKEK